MSRISGVINWWRKRSIRVKSGSVIAVILMGWWAWSTFFGNKQTSVQYQTSVAERGTLVTSISASGSITNGNKSDIVTAATGEVTKLYVKNGDTVLKGQKIAELSLDLNSMQTSASAWGAYLSAKNQLAAAKNNVYQLQAAEFAANQKLINDAVARGLTTDDPTYIQENAAWLMAETNYKNQDQVIQVAQIGLNNAAMALQNVSATITAPATGKVNNLVLAEGLLLTSTSSSSSSSSTTTKTVGQINLSGTKTLAVVNVSEIDAPKIASGEKVTLTLDSLPNKTFTGKVLGVNTSGQVSSGVTTYPASIVFDSADDSIYTNMGVTANIITLVKDDVILVPSAAVQTANGSSIVRIMKNKTVSTVGVEVGDSNDTQTEIVSGVNEGDNVVTSSTSATSASRQTGTTSVFGALGGAGNRGGNFGGAVRIQGR